MKIIFRNPMEGPLITVSFDDEDDGGVVKGFAPAPVPPATVLPGAKALIDLGNAAGTGSSRIVLGPLAAYVAPLICSGDSGSRRLVAQDVHARPAPPVASTSAPASPVVLADELTPTSASAAHAAQWNFLNALRHLVEGSTILSGFQREHLSNWIEMAMVGGVAVAVVLQKIDEFLTEDLVRRAVAVGATVDMVPEGTRFSYDPKNTAQAAVLDALFAIMRALDPVLMIEHMRRSLFDVSGALVQDREERNVVILPRWQEFSKKYAQVLEGLQVVAHAPAR